MRLRITALAALALCALANTALAQSSGIQLGQIDKTCQPCRDFYQYANGAWTDTVSIPAMYSSIGVGREMFDRNQDMLHSVLISAAQNISGESNETLVKVGALYATLMDSARAERDGVTPIQPYLDRINAIQSRKVLLSELADMHKLGLLVPFYFGAQADAKQSQWMLGTFYQGGLGLPERDYYMKTDTASVSLRKAYVAHVAKTFQLAGMAADAAVRDAERVMAFEMALAKASRPNVELRDPDKNYNKITVRELQKQVPAIAWADYFASLGVATLASPDSFVNVAQPDFMKEVSRQVASTPLESWRAYLRYHAIDNSAGWLSQEFFDENFTFNARLTGARAPLPRWKRAADAVDGALGEALGRAWVEKNFTPAAKARMLELVDNLQRAYQKRIESLAWMSDATKKQALVKLSTFTRKIGYPDRWRDYSAIKIQAGQPAILNLVESNRFERARDLAKIGKAVDRNEWFLSPPTVNAYYNPPNNEIVFPAGILQPPMFDLNADDAANYGAIGMVIGHELTHGFDDEGSKYDAEGNLKNWWTEGDRKAFEELAGRIDQQYSGYVAVDTLKVNGKLTLGENIADLGGLTMAYYAYQASLEGKPRLANLDGFTPEQRFFLGFAQSWRRKMRPERLKLMVNTDPHSPANWRVNGPIANMPEFAKAFGCKAGDAMVHPPEKAAVIW
ncbi:MAG: M13 family metallopeptidase [Candidatus Eisenbacteria bacterium]|uniref:M13 family metallopeptidase n=1 Tax=Eiseniibacteriota bacterium TaxID=2212470 RepID=A0A849SKX3_UNCEI|nr:M13 family metallopeptidase [Candidatus Eisenbacteria bacterium]